jgi:SEC-C motif-containing protein
MRSRFTAHVARDHAYLHRTYRGTADTPYVDEPDPEPMQWSRLIIHAHEPGNGDTAFVDFSAFFVDEGGEHEVREKSEFVRSGEGWLYTRAVRTGPPPFKAAAPKVGRNEPCPCGSGKKYKHCCWGKVA